METSQFYFVWDLCIVCLIPYQTKYIYLILKTGNMLLLFQIDIDFCSCRFACSIGWPINDASGAGFCFLNTASNFNTTLDQLGQEFKLLYICLRVSQSMLVKNNRSLTKQIHLRSARCQGVPPA